MRSYRVPPIPRSIWQKPSHFIAFGFGSGAIPIAPGTAGSLMAIPFYLLISTLSLRHYLIAIILVIMAIIFLCEKVSREIDVHDHQGMCLDEFAGVFVAMTGLPAHIAWITAGFVLFRLFDILKPWPIAWIDRHVHGGFGMVLDDVLAGLYAMILLQGILWVMK